MGQQFAQPGMQPGYGEFQAAHGQPGFPPAQASYPGHPLQGGSRPRPAPGAQHGGDMGEIDVVQMDPSEAAARSYRAQQQQPPMQSGPAMHHARPVRSPASPARPAIRCMSARA